MKDMIKQAMGKDDGAGDMHKNAKLNVLKELRKMASDMMGGDISEGMKKVTVASDSKEGLAKGLDKAKDMVGDKGPHEEDPEHEAMESGLEEEAEHDPLTDWDQDLSKYSPEEIDAKIAELQAAKNKMRK